MEIKKDDKNLILEIPLRQSGGSEWGNKWCVQNLIAVKTWDKSLNDWDYTISQANYLNYKDDLQEGMPIVHLSKEEFEEAVKLLELDVWEHQKCSECGKAIWGSFTTGEKGDVCMGCEQK